MNLHKGNHTTQHFASRFTSLPHKLLLLLLLLLGWVKHQQQEFLIFDTIIVNIIAPKQSVTAAE